MPEYRLAPAAADDLLEIARYTIKKWGPEQDRRYEAALRSCFKAVARNDALEKPVFEYRDDFRVSRCEHHYVFFVREDQVTILAVLHENMDLLARFRERLEAGW